MNRIAAKVLALAITLCSLSAFAGENQYPPRPAISDAQRKPPVCQWTCTQWDDNGSCAHQEYICY